MKGNPDVIACLKELLRGELAALKRENASNGGTIGTRSTPSISHGLADVDGGGEKPLKFPYEQARNLEPCREHLEK